MAFSMFGDYTDGTDVYPSIATIAEMVGLSNATKVHPHRKKLVEFGYLADTGVRSSADTVVYSLTAPTEVISTATAEREARVRRKPEKAPTAAVADAPDSPAPPGRACPSDADLAAFELTLEQKIWFLDEREPNSWPWSDIPYALAERAYKLYCNRETG
ncbi:Lrp/AsnC family transcriptional regulator [Streptomyces niveiscabiei]|uniref:Lrp/AsnC family transcriptional regulator n=1 Tax=Streptomyces niveiscabiei TaxID=164115 RepID=UPI0029BCF612|nr:Lrp/AsnC family transcriptional regulator [Streptomyces niveiscabiei]MDX3387261.1 Lrp/AsnC family transcriptional regulator [Streptomyces niveiscabiei]